MTTTQIPFDWAKTIDEQLLLLSDIPLLGNPPPFPWTEFSKKIAEKLELADHLTIEPGNLSIRGEQELYQDLSSPLSSTEITFAGFEGAVFFVFPQDEIKLLMNGCLTKQPEVPITSIDKEFEEGFYHFLAIELINAFSELNFDPSLTPHLSQRKDLFKADALSQDIHIHLFHHKLLGRFIFSNPFLNSWKKYFAKNNLAPHLNASLKEKVGITLALEGGRSSLTHSQFSSLEKGDFLFLDQCTLGAKEGNSHILLTFNDTPLYRGALEKNGIKILEACPVFELYTYDEPLNPKQDLMDDENQNEEEAAEEELSEELEEFDEELNLEEEEEDFDFETEEEQPVETDTEEVGTETTVQEEEAKVAKKAPAKKEAPPSAALQNETKVVKAVEKPEKTMLTAKDLPLTMVVEVGRIELPVGKLLALTAGNLLEIPSHPESPVSLVIGGKCVGKAELLRVGDTLGIRILELG